MASPGCRNGGGDTGRRRLRCSGYRGHLVAARDVTGDRDAGRGDTGTHIGTDPARHLEPAVDDRGVICRGCCSGQGAGGGGGEPHPILRAERHALFGVVGRHLRSTAYQAVAHPSLPNYLAIIGGSTFGVTDDRPPADHPVPGASVLDLAIAKTATAKAYIEDMPGPCTLDSNGDYAVKHNPWAYFADPTARRNCRSFDLPAGTATGGALHDDVQAGTLPTIGMLIPNLCHDAHNCPLATADAWLQQWMPVLMQGPDYRSGHLAIVITFDEDDNSGDNTVLTTVIAPTVHHVSAATPLTHYSLTGYLAELTATPPPGEAATAPSLSTAFGL